MNNYLVLGTCFLLGIVLRRSGRLPDNAAAALNGFLVHISLPALILAYVHELHLDARLILPALMPWILFGLGCGYFWLVGKALGFSPATIGGLMLTGGLANTAFIGLPMIEAFYGSEFLGLGILIDQVAPIWFFRRWASSSPRFIPPAKASMPKQSSAGSSSLCLSRHSCWRSF